MQTPIDTIGIAVITYPPYEEARNLLSNVLEDIKFPCVFVDANTQSLVDLLVNPTMSSTARLDTICGTNTESGAWVGIQHEAHIFATESLAAHTLEYEKVHFWLILEDDLFISPVFKGPLRRLLAELPKEADIVLLAGDSLLSELSAVHPLETLVKVDFPKLSQIGAYLIPVGRLKAVSEALRFETTNQLNSYAFLGAPPLIYQYRDDILPCVLRLGPSQFAPSHSTQS